MKGDIAERHPGDRLGYIGEKDSYVEALEARALEWHKDKPED